MPHQTVNDYMNLATCIMQIKGEIRVLNLSSGINAA